MRIKAFHRCKGLHGRQRFLQSPAIILHNARSPLELVYGQAREGNSSAACGQCVARSSHIIAQNRWGVRTDKDRARGDDALDRGCWFPKHQFAMLWGKPINQCNALIHRLHLNEPAILFESASDEFAARQPRQLTANFLFDRTDQLQGRREEPHSFVPGSMFSLRKQISRDKSRVGRVIGEHQHFARPGKQIDCDMPKEQPLGGNDVRIAGTEYLRDVANRRCAKRHRGHSLHSADAVDFGSACGSNRE